VSKAGKALYQWNLNIKEACASFGDCLSRLDQDCCDKLLEEWRATQKLIGEPNPNSESQIGHHRRFHHAGKMITQCAYLNNLKLPDWAQTRWPSRNDHPSSTPS
jgi:hypothetical protein